MSETNDYVSPYVGDGYDELVTIPAVPGQWSAAQVRIRRLSADEESLIFTKKNLSPLTSMVSLYAEAFAGNPKEGAKAKILGWDLKRRDEKGQLMPLPISAESIRGLSPGFFDALKCRIDGSFVLPSGETQAESDEKNS